MRNKHSFKRLVSQYEQMIHCYPRVYIFGAGAIAGDEVLYCRWNGKEAKACIVSRRQDNPENLNDTPVIEIAEISPDDRKTSLVLIARNKSADSESREILKQYGFCNIAGGLARLDIDLRDQNLIEAMAMYGETPLSAEQVTWADGSGGDICNTVKIYACTSIYDLHKPKVRWKSEYISYIQGGTALTTDRIAEFSDSDGEDNISDENPYYSEISAGYWIANNDDVHDYVGLYHYSRGLDLTDEQVRNIVCHGDVDCVFPMPYRWEYDLFSFGVTYEVLEAIEKTDERYVNAAIDYFRRNIVVPGNIFLAKRDVFKACYEFMMPVLRNFSDIRKSKGTYAKRILGYAAEYLTNIFFIHHADDYK